MSSVLTRLIKKLNYILLLHYYIYTRKPQNDSPPLLPLDFITKIKYKYKIEKEVNIHNLPFLLFLRYLDCQFL